MPSADAKPVAVRSSHTIHCKSQSPCQDQPPYRAVPTTPTILLFEKNSLSTPALKFDLELGTKWKVEHGQSLDEALRFVATLRSSLKIAIITVGRDRSPADKFIRHLKETSVANAVLCPHILILSLGGHGPEIAADFERSGAHYLLRAHSDQIVDQVKKFQWQSLLDKSLPTIIVRRNSGHVVQVVVRSNCGDSRIEVGPRLRKLVEYLALHSRIEHTTEMIADSLGICRQSVKEYMFRLRRAFDETRKQSGIHQCGNETFWTRRIAGGFIHGVNANIKIEDSAPYGVGDQ